jgi:hypothetical protein
VSLRLDVVQDASFRVGDLEIGILTGGVDAGHPIDTGRTEPDGHWTDAWLTVNGVERRVTGYSRPGQFETNAFPFTPHAGDPYELRKDQLHTREQMIAFANAAVRDVQLTAWVLLDSYLDDLGDLPVAVTETTAYPVPPEMDCVYKILYQAPVDQNDANWYPISHNDWNVIEPELVTLYEPLIPLGSRVRLLGTRRPREMPNDQTTCEVEPSFVAVFAAKLMCLRMMKGSDADRMKAIYAALKQEEETLRRTMRLRQPNNVRRVRPTGTGATPGHVAVPPSMARASQWYTGDAAPTYAIGRPGDFYLQGDGTVWEYRLPGGWTPTTTDLTGPQGQEGNVDAATLEYDQPDEPLDVVPAP